MRARGCRAFTLLEVLAAVVVVSVGFAGVVSWLSGHGRVLAREQRSLAVQREAQNAYERAMAFPLTLVDTAWEFRTAGGDEFTVRLNVLDSLDWPVDSLYRPWPREAELTICLRDGEGDCPVRWFLAAGGVDNVP
jgi:prepilin-type N-terminal cleavage/methylation domain-containing protein